jgi:hypothetical protein
VLHIVELERAGRLKYETEMRARKIPVNLDDAIYPDIMLEEKYWPKATTLPQSTIRCPQTGIGRPLTITLGAQLMLKP